MIAIIPLFCFVDYEVDYLKGVGSLANPFY